jgi:hypothetical protein
MAASLDTILDVVAKGASDLAIAAAILDGELERTIDGASTLTLELLDADGTLMRHRDLRRSVDFHYADSWWRMVKVAKHGNRVTLTFEDRDVAYLRRHKGPRKVARKTMTRAEFVRTLVREVGRRPAKAKDELVAKRRIRFVCPELHVRQPVAKEGPNKPAKRSRATRNATRQPGVADAARLTVKGARATAEQRRNGERVLDVADALGAGPKATKALMEAVIVESLVRNLSYGHADSLGILQVRVSTSGSATRSRDIEWCCRQFLTAGFWGKGGAIKLAQDNPGKSAGWVAQQCQGSAVPDAYDLVADEADAWIGAYGGASGTDTGGVSSTRPRRKRYEFSRGQAGKPEDSWTAIQRLASEVNWRAFMDHGALYFVSEDHLMRSRPRAVISEDDDGVNTIDFDLDYGKVRSELRISCRAGLYDVAIGSVVVIRDMGLANGRYLVTSVRRGIFDADTEIMVRRPTPKTPEPQAETVTRTGGTRAGQGDVTITTDGGAGGIRDRIVAVAEASRSSYNRNPNAWHYLAGGTNNYDDPTRPPRSRGMRSDCSQWIAAVYKKAGAPAPGPSYSAGIFTGNMRVRGHAVPVADARPGDVIWWPQHCELYVGPGNRTIGHGSPPVDYGTTTIFAGATCWRYDFLD